MRNLAVTPRLKKHSPAGLTWFGQLVCCLALTALPAAAEAPSRLSPKVLLIGLDGIRGDALQKASTPTIDRLLANGIVDWDTRVVSPEVTSSDTVSGPGWTTFLTGTWSDRHGVIDNSFKGRTAARAPHCFRLAKQSQPQLRTASFLDWTPLSQHVTSDADLDIVVTPSAASHEYDGADRALTLMAAAVLQNEPIDLAFVYLGAIDEAGHKFGFHPSVEEYTRRIATADAQLGQLLRAVRARNTFDNEDWLFVLSADHGGEGRGHGGGRDNPLINRVPMIVSGAAAARGEDVARPVATTDVVAVALQHLRIPIDPQWQLAGSADGWLSAAASAPVPAQPANHSETQR